MSDLNTRATVTLSVNGQQAEKTLQLLKKNALDLETAISKAASAGNKADLKRLRRELTKEGRHLWYDCLKQLPVTVHPQKVLGNFIVDFYIASCKIVIEVDGSQHYEETHQEKDLQRDGALTEMGCKVLRYSNADINTRFKNVCLDIHQHIRKNG